MNKALLSNTKEKNKAKNIFHHKTTQARCLSTRDLKLLSSNGMVNAQALWASFLRNVVSHLHHRSRESIPECRYEGNTEIQHCREAHHFAAYLLTAESHRRRRGAETEWISTAGCLTNLLTLGGHVPFSWKSICHKYLVFLVKVPNSLMSAVNSASQLCRN